MNCCPNCGGVPTDLGEPIQHHPECPVIYSGRLVRFILRMCVKADHWLSARLPIEWTVHPNCGSTIVPIVEKENNEMVVICGRYKNINSGNYAVVTSISGFTVYYIYHMIDPSYTMHLTIDEFRNRFEREE